mgnify:CR=1 FL=1
MTDQLPSTYDENLFNQILDVIREGKRVKSALDIVNDINDLDEPITIGRWAYWLESSPQLAAAYARANDLGIDSLVDQLFSVPYEVADPQRARLICDNIKWYAAKVAHRRYGDRVDVNINEKPRVDQVLEEANKRRERLMRDLVETSGPQVIDVQPELPTEPTDEQSDAPDIFD